VIRLGLFPVIVIAVAAVAAAGFAASGRIADLPERWQAMRELEREASARAQRAPTAARAADPELEDLRRRERALRDALARAAQPAAPQADETADPVGLAHAHGLEVHALEPREDERRAGTSGLRLVASGEFAALAAWVRAAGGGERIAGLRMTRQGDRLMLEADLVW